MMTSGKISEHIKVDVGVEPVSLASTNDTGAYHSMMGWKRACFVFAAAAMAATKTVVAQVMKATDGIATGATALTSAAATITACVKATKALLTGNTIADEDTVVTVSVLKDGASVSSVIYSCEDTDPDIDAGEFGSGANDTAACVELAAAINHLQGDYLKATASTTTVILAVKEPGEYTISLSDAHATIVPSTLEAIGYVEVDAAQLGAGYTHVALKLTTDATIVVGATLVREGLGGGRSATTQQVAAGTVL
jgi:hypothetical protein